MMKRLIYLGSSLFWLTLMLPVSGAIAQPEPDGAWLDDTTNWNTVGAAIPQAPTYEDGNNLPNCETNIRPASLPEDALVEAAGWTLTGSAQVYGINTLITGMADADGMCRPLDYQVFIFTDGEFSGTLSPIPMDSRTDGSLNSATLYGNGFIDASFSRYTPDDPLCCASGQSRLFYEIDLQQSGAVVMPQLPASTVYSSEEETSNGAIAPFIRSQPTTAWTQSR